MAKTIRLKGLTCEQNNKKFYISVMTNEVLKDICFVARRDENAEQGFQRTLNEARAKDIAAYLDDFKGTIPSAVILSAQDNSRFTFNEKNQEISFQAEKNSFMVLDGQHRLYGLLKTKNIHQIPVVIFKGLTTTNEVNLFIDINTTQKGVPTSLLLDIKNLSGKETKKEDRQRKLFDRLNTESVLAGLLSPTKSQVGKITRLAFNQATNDLFEGGFFHDKDNDFIFNGIKNYIAAAEIVFKNSKSERAKLTNSILFKSLFAIFQEIVDKSLKEFSDLKIDSIVNVLNPISRINYDSYVGTSNATQTKIIGDMRKELNDYQKRFSHLESSELF